LTESYSVAVSEKMFWLYEFILYKKPSTKISEISGKFRLPANFADKRR